MSNQKQATPSATATKAQQKPAPAPTQEAVAAPEMAGLAGSIGIASFQSSAQQLGNPNLQRVQRQMMAGRIGQVQGNGHLGQVVAFTKQRQHSAPVQFKRVQPKGIASPNIVKAKPKLSTSVQNQSQADEANRPEEQRTREEPISLSPVAGGAAGNTGTPNLAHTVVNGPAQNDSATLAVTTAPVAAQQATVQRWGLSDLVPDSVKKIGRGIAKAATSAWDKVANVAQIALDYAAKKASSIPGYTLLTFVLGKDPIADQEVPRTPMNLVHGVVGLIPGGEQLFKNLQESNVLQQVFDWLDEQLTKLNLTWTYVKGLFSKAWKALSIGDFVPPSKAFNKVKQIFSPLITKIKNFAIAAGNKLWEMALEGALKLVGPGGGKVMGIIKKAGAAFGKIIKDPIGFLGNLISGVGQGIDKFGGRILDHLQKGFVAWLTGAAPGLRIEMPDDIFSLSGIFSLVTQVLGLTWDYVRQKAVKLVGERVVSTAEKVFEPFQILITQGPGGLWEYLKGQLSNMAELVIGQVKDLMITQAIQAGIKWVMKLLSPASALVGAAKAIYDIVMFVVDKAGQIGDFVGAVMNSISAIANGAVGSAASLIERALAKALPLVIGLLANLAGLGDIANKVMGVIRKVKAKIDGVIDKLIGKVKRLFKRGKGKGQDQTSDPKANEQAKKLARQRVSAVTQKPFGDEDTLRQTVKNIETDLRAKGLNSLSIKPKNGKNGEFDIVARQMKSDDVGDATISTVPPLTKVSHSPTNGKAGNVLAEPLSNVSGNTTGGVPGNTNVPGWKHAQALNKQKQEWVRMHLLSEKLHGPGAIWNLTPGRTRDNQLMELSVEKDAKLRISQGEILFYVVDVSYHQPEVDFPEKENFPSRISVTWGNMEKRGEQYIRGKPRTWSLALEPPPQNAGTVTVYINKDGRVNLERFLGISRTLAERIIKEREENGAFTITDFRDRLQRRMPERFATEWPSMADALQDVNVQLIF